MTFHATEGIGEYPDVMNPRASISAHRVAGLTLALLLVPVLLSSCANPFFPGFVRRPSWGIHDRSGHEHMVPLPDLPVEGTYLVSADVAVGADRVVHVVSWHVYGPAGAPIGSHVYYERGNRDSSGWIWTRPHLLRAGFGGFSRIFVDGVHVHVLVDKSLRHLSSDDGGNSWTDHGDLLGTLGASSFDAVAEAETLIVLYAVKHPSVRTRGNLALRLQSIRVEPGKTTRQVLSEFPGIKEHGFAPSLSVVGSDVYALWGPGAASARDSVSEDSLTLAGSARSTDGGRSWIPWDAPPPRALRSRTNMGGSPGELVVSSDRTAIRALWTDGGLRRFRWQSQGGWDEGVALDDSRPVAVDPSMGQGSRRLVSTPRGDVAIWASLRNEDWSWGEWGLDLTGMGNDDVFAATFSGGEGRPGKRLHRLTKPFSRTVSLSAAARGDTIYVLRTGYRFRGSHSPEKQHPTAFMSLTSIGLSELFER